MSVTYLSEQMTEDLDASDVEVFRKFVTKLMFLQKKTFQRYQEDKFVRGRLITDMDIESIQDVLRDRMPRSA